MVPNRATHHIYFGNKTHGKFVKRDIAIKLGRGNIQECNLITFLKYEIKESQGELKSSSNCSSNADIRKNVN